MLAAILIAQLSCTPGPSSADARREAYATIRQTCTDEGAAIHVCEAAVAMAWRESRGIPTKLHTRGPGEYGVGLYGHSLRFWGWLLRPAGLGKEAFCSPRLATLALLREFQFAHRRGARTLRDLQRVHSGRRPTDDRDHAKDARWCYLLRHGPRDDQHVISWESLDCETRITAEDLGRPLTKERIGEAA